MIGMIFDSAAQVSTYHALVTVVPYRYVVVRRDASEGNTNRDGSEEETSEHVVSKVEFDCYGYALRSQKPQPSAGDFEGRILVISSRNSRPNEGSGKCDCLPAF